MKKNNFKLGVGCVSKEVIIAVFKYSAENNVPIMLLVSRNQVDWNGGYVNNWNTGEYVDFVKQQRIKYPKADVILCRDHCGPGFRDNSLENTYKTIQSDMDLGFRLIHIDFSKSNYQYDDILNESRKAIEFIANNNRNIMIEVGTEKNTGKKYSDSELERINDELRFFSSIVPLQYYVCQTGSLVRENKQAGKFNREFILKVKDLSDKFNVSLKEHNADYLDDYSIISRGNLIGAMNIAPQFGVLQTNIVLSKCLLYGIDSKDFMVDAYRSNRWIDWVDEANYGNKNLCAIISGHYVFSEYSYKSIVDKIMRFEDVERTIIDNFMVLIDRYIKNIGQV